MSVLIAISGWDPTPWRARMESLLPSHEIVMLDESFDRASVRYALSWRHPPGALKDLPNLQVDSLARRRRRSPIRRSRSPRSADRARGRP